MAAPDRSANARRASAEVELRPHVGEEGLGQLELSPVAQAATDLQADDPFLVARPQLAGQLETLLPVAPGAPRVTAQVVIGAARRYPRR